MSFWEGVGDLLSGGAISAGRAQRAGINAAMPIVQKGYTDAQGNIAQGYGQAQEALKPLAGESAGVYGTLANKVQNGGFDVNTPGFDASAFGKNFQADPGYEFAKNEGLKSINANAKANGNMDSGATQKALMNYGTGVANQEYNQDYNRAQTTNTTNNQTALQNSQQQFGQMNATAQPAFGVAGTLANSYAQQGQQQAGLNTGLATDMAGLETSKGAVNGQIAGAGYSGVNSLLNKAGSAAITTAFM